MSYSPEQRRALACVLDEVIPPSDDGRLPGAGELGLAEHLEQNVPELEPFVVQGLAALDELAGGRGAEGFATLPRADRPEVLNEHAVVDPGFLPGLIFQTYVAYYMHDRVVEALGFEARPPFPKGFDLEQGDLGRLERVRSGPRMYREV